VSANPERTSVATLASTFLKLGTIAFGGPAAHIAMMEREFVRERGWLTGEQFLDLVGTASLIPGPSSTEVAIYIGYRRAGWLGLFVAGSCFILPAALIVTALAWAYTRFGRIPAIGGVLYGVKASVIAVIAQALVRFACTAARTPGLLVLGLLALAAGAYGLNPVAAIAGAGVVSAAVRGTMLGVSDSTALVLAVPAVGPTAITPAIPVGLWKLCAIFLKIGSVVFGSGYVLLAFLHADLVERTRWLTEAQLIDAVAVGQVTPGPVFTTATFIGYLLGGIPGAIVATVAIFLPSFLLVAVSGPLIPLLRRSPVAAAFLDGVNVASLAVMAVVTAQLGRAAIVDATTALLAIVSALLLFRWNVNSAWLVLGAGIAGAAAQWSR
jgi:chromate transporter